MNKFPKICFGFFIAAILTSGHVFLTNSAPALAWQLLPRVGDLDERSRSELREVLNGELNYGECREAILQCIFREKPDKTAVRVANFCAYLVSKGVRPDTLGLFIKERAKFANESTHPFTYSNTPVMGNQEAPIAITEFAEFKCRHCVILTPVLRRLVEQSNGAVRLHFKHFPLKSHHGSVLASTAAQAAHRQGKFWEMYNLLFKDFNKQGMEDIMQYARTLNLNLQRLKADMEHATLVALIERDKREGLGAGVKGTPTLFINGKMHNLRNDEAFLKDVINEEAERLGVTPPYKDWDYGLSKR